MLTSCLAAVLLLFVGVVAPGANPAAGTFVYAGCSPSKYAPSTAFESNLNSLLASISSAAGDGSGTRAAIVTEATATVTGAAPSSSPAHSLYQCRGDLSAGECVSCVRDTAARLGFGSTCGAASLPQSDGCHVARHDADDDASAMAYRRCGSGTSEDAAFLKARDAVLAQLQDGAAAASPGYYKVSDSGEVRGVAQCLSDVAAADCAACLAQAVGQIKGTCGDALAAEVYLAQCSVRYWANGNFFRSSHGTCMQIQ